MTPATGRHAGRLTAPRSAAPVAALAALLAISVIVSSCRFEPLPRIRVDGSSTVFPITEAVAEEFQFENRGLLVTVGVSGTGGGFAKMLVREAEVIGASRYVSSGELQRAQAEGIELLELEVAFDGLSVVMHPADDFVDYLTVEELRRIWEPGSTVRTWQDVRPEWPAQRIYLVGADTASGTFDYFTEAIVGEAGATRTDYTASANDDMLAQAVAGTRYSLGYFGFAYLVENRDRLRAVPVDPGDGTPVLPTFETINDSSYRPLSRPLLVYVRTEALVRPEVEAFVRYFLTEGRALAAEVGYVPMPDERYDEQLALLDQAVVEAYAAAGAG